MLVLPLWSHTVPSRRVSKKDVDSIYQFRHSPAVRSLDKDCALGFVILFQLFVGCWHWLSVFRHSCSLVFNRPSSNLSRHGRDSADDACTSSIGFGDWIFALNIMFLSALKPACSSAIISSS